METENVIFLRKLRNSYGNLTDKRNSYVFLKRNSEIGLRMNGNVTLETKHYAYVSANSAAERIGIRTALRFASKRIGDRVRRTRVRQISADRRLTSRLGLFSTLCDYSKLAEYPLLSKKTEALV